MSPALYRRHRPQKFSEIIGQNYIKTILQNQLSANSVAQAYLFCGPRAVGKTTMARVLAKAANCLERKAGDFEPCNNCISCQGIDKGSNLSVLEIDAASNTGVDNVRENIISSSRVSVGQGYKIFIIDEVHMLSLSAFNALLKTLEEPVGKNIFILCTTEVHKLPLTVISRCQRFDFRRLKPEEVSLKIKKILKAEGIEAEEEVITALAIHSEGYLRDAESLLEQLLAIAENKKIDLKTAELVLPKNDLNELIQLLEFLINKEASPALGVVNDLATGGFNLKKFNQDLLELLRKMLLAKISSSLADSWSKDFGEAYEKKISILLTKLDEARLREMLNRFSQSLNEIKTSFISQLPLELAIVDLCSSYVSPKKPEANLSRQFNSAPGPLLQATAIEKKWEEFVLQTRKINHSISFLFQAGKISQINNGEVIMAFRYKFHKDRWDSPAVQEDLKKVSQSVYKTSLVFSSLLDESVFPKIEEEKKDSGEESLFLNQILKNFGGEVVS